MNNRKKKLMIEYSVIVVSILAIFLIVASFGLTGYLKTKNNVSDKGQTVATSADIQQTLEETQATIDEKIEEHKKLNVVVYGVDKAEMLTDVIFVVSFDTYTKKIGILSIPRDTRVKIPDSRLKVIKNSGRYVPSDGYVKINEVHSYAGKENDVEYSTKQIEELLGITIDKYVKMNLSGFKNIVDAIGGVDMDVPYTMDYDDPEQNLHIHLKKGQQHLDGKQAEQLVRYRSYPQGDVMRVNVQQLFMEELLNKVLNAENLITNAPKLAYNIFKYVKTDFGLTDILDYIRYVDDIKSENITMKVLPGEGQTINKLSYFIYDDSETKTLVKELFYSE